MEPKFETQFSKNVMGGGSQEEKDAIHGELQGMLEERSYEDLKPYELEPTEKDRQIMGFAMESVDKAISAYGIASKPFPSEKIFIVKHGSVEELTNGKLKGGFHGMIKQRIVVERPESDISFAVMVAHELFHLKSPKMAQISNGKGVPYRSGVTAFDRSGKTEYFAELEEAIVAEMTRRFYESEVVGSQLFETEIKKTGEIKSWIGKVLDARGVDESMKRKILDEIFFVPDADDMLEVINRHDKTEEYKIGYVNGAFERLLGNKEIALSERYRERKELYGLIDAIADGSEGEFESREQIFGEFAKANFSGKLLPLARMIERSLGKGSFRKVGERFKKEW